MSIITLLTDFGIEDEYDGVMKGVILSINPSAVIVDITHHVDPYDLIQAAFLIRSFYSYFPNKTIHVIVVDPGVGTNRAVIAIQKEGQIFLAPDNGILTLIAEDRDVEQIIRVENSKYFLGSISQTFHGRDIFAPVAAHLSKRLELAELGTPVDIQSLKHLNIPKPFISEKNELEGTIISIDRFGNLITNIDAKSLQDFCKTDTDRLDLQICGQVIHGLSQNYQSVKQDSILAIIGSRGYLEIAVNCGNAQQYLKAAKGGRVVLSTKMRGAGFRLSPE